MEIKNAKEGVFAAIFTPSTFCTVSDASAIGRVKFDVVPVGSNGKNNIAFYLRTTQMLALCEEILNGTFAKKVAADAASAYPSAYRYVTGEDGSLHLNIGGGKKGCRIQAQDSKTKKSHIVVASIEDMMVMARNYKLWMGLTPVTPNSYYAGVVKAFDEGRAERMKYAKNRPEESIGDVIDANAQVDESAAAPAPAAAPATAAPKAEKKGDQEIVGHFVISVSGKKREEKGFFAFDGVDADGNKVKVLFKQADAPNYKWFAKFENTAAAAPTKLNFNGRRKGNTILFESV